ncbi:MAG: alpha/beta fold hydrolase [Wenzhouxiangellaceae bacterium]|nr:alpha/beta fold hydrolase [Wenzhouxiangellaceae bacterium]
MWLASKSVSPVPAKTISAQASLSGVAHDRVLDHPELGTIGWRMLGADHLPLVAVLGGISAGRDVDSWWASVVGRGRPLDPERFRILSFDWIDRLPDSTRAPGTPEQADVLEALRLECGADGFHAVVGSSFGAMVALQYAARHPDAVGQVVAISGAHRSTPTATAHRLLQRRIVTECGDAGVALARALALTGYRPETLLDRQFEHPDAASRLADLASYFEYNGRRFAERCDARRYLVLSEALDLHELDPTTIRCPVTLVGAESDRLVPLKQLVELQRRIGEQARLEVIESPFGHDAFLKSPELINPLLTRALRADEEACHAC